MKTLFYRVAAERNWPAGDIIEGWQESSRYWVALDPMGEVVAATKLVCGDPADFPIKKRATRPQEEEAWPDLHIPEKGLAAEVAFAAVDKRYRGDGRFYLAMHAKMYWDVCPHSVRYIYAILDPFVYGLARRFGFRFVELGPEVGGGRKVYWGELTLPARVDLEESAEFVATRKPNLWSFVLSYAPPGHR